MNEKINYFNTGPHRPVGRSRVKTAKIPFQVYGITGLTMKSANNRLKTLITVLKKNRTLPIGCTDKITVFFNSVYCIWVLYHIITIATKRVEFLSTCIVHTERIVSQIGLTITLLKGYYLKNYLIAK